MLNFFSIKSSQKLGRRVQELETGQLQGVQNPDKSIFHSLTVHTNENGKS